MLGYDPRGLAELSAAESGRYLTDLSPGGTHTADESSCAGRTVAQHNSVFQWREEKSGGCSPAFATYVRTIPEIPALVINDHGCYLLRGKRNLLVSSHFDDAALAGDDLIETPSALELD